MKTPFIQLGDIGNQKPIITFDQVPFDELSRDEKVKILKQAVDFFAEKLRETRSL